MNYSIGELSKIFNISTQTLRYYDQIKLFSPLYREGNNYRVYSSSQFQELRTILYLKNIGVSLKSIKEYKDKKELRYLYKILEIRKQKIEDKIKELDDLNKSIKSTLVDINTSFISDEIKYPKIKIIDSRRAYLLNKKFTHKNISENIEYLIKDIYIEKIKRPELDVRNLGTIVSYEDLLDKNYSTYSGIFMLQYESSWDKLIEFPKGTYASIYHKGNYDTIGKSYEKLISFIKENCLTIKSFSIELALIDIKLSLDPKDYITEIQILVQ
ncbi:MerR family transcriptional regulator [Peptoniphilus sp. SGI.035]|uniref:MerR family transcriptional regulator n=1 Tax=Peptoniphilus sp. SGI.035 TaxID=3420564 RepID=UPI003D01F25D